MKICGTLALSFLASVASAAGTTDHGGGDLIINGPAVLSGIHTNIRNFVLADRVVLTVAPYIGSAETGEGTLEIHAQNITVLGMIDARGAGYTGGSGGGSGRQNAGDSNYPGYIGYAVPNSEGGYGVPGPDETSFGGSGSKGDGPFGGLAGAIGGYSGTGMNDDTTTNTVTSMGSGGGGGQGAQFVSLPFPVTPGGGGGGGRGGGNVRLFGDTVIINGYIRVDGALGGNSSLTGTGGDSAPANTGISVGSLFVGQSGGAGAGGGILIVADQLSGSGVLTSFGGTRTGNRLANGGTIKVLTTGALPAARPFARGGRVYEHGGFVPE